MLRRVSAGVRTAMLAAGVMASACGGGPENSAPATPAAPVTNPVDPATAGNVAGKVSFEGTAPAPAAVRMDSDPNCKPQGSGGVDESVVVGTDGALQNVFVYVKDGLGNLRFPVPTTPAILDQRGCVYTPHVVGVQLGQPLEIVNSDPTLHNVHAIPAANQEFNTGQPIQGMKTAHTFSTKEVMVPFKCDVHGWMRAYVGVLDHPYFAVTGPDGTFSLAGLPPGTYTVEAWHETLGTQTQTVTIGEKESKDVAFSFKRA
jgi:plastocyanin